MEEQSLNLLELIYGLVERLMLDSQFDANELGQLIDSVRDDLDLVKEQYQAPAPEGAEAVQELMLESLELFDSSFAEVSEFLDDQDEDRLRRAVAQAEDANDILSAVEQVIQENKLVLSEMVSA